MSDIEQRVKKLETLLLLQQIKINVHKQVLAALIIEHPDTAKLSQSLERMSQVAYSLHINDPLVSDDVREEFQAYVLEFAQLAKDETSRRAGYPLQPEPPSQPL